MKIEFKKDNLGNVKSGLLCVFVLQGEKPPHEITPLMKGLGKDRFEGKTGQTYYTETLGNAKFAHLLVVGMGERKKFILDNLRRAAGTSVRYAKSMKEKEIIVFVPSVPKTTAIQVAQAITEGVMLAEYKFDEYKTERKDIFNLKTATILSEQDIGEGVRLGQIYANAQNYSRLLDEKPANIATPTMIAKEAQKLAKQNKLGLTIYNKKSMEKMKLGGVLAVSQGSVQAPVLLKLEYNKGKNYPLYCIVGKGITFDSGGISIKPSNGMHEMKYDKTGAINVLGIMKAVSELGLNIRVIGLAPLCENTPSGSAQKPGDVITIRNGKTVEVLNTDAEGRLILADALSLAVEEKPKAIIDMATLTGAIVVCLGRHAAGLFSNDDKLAKVIEDAGIATHERVWRLPVWPEYSEMMKSDIADLKNISEQHEAGSITAAAFLKEFVGEVPWAHLDIAGVEMVKLPHPYLEKGATCTGVRLVTNALEKMQTK
ncbi:leucyl aminopeptidase [Candidatus Micrarchaeota archaeon]|nr:leucyl aminopeptidase [Candidatus Micrarchaeota archaeon]